MASPSHQVDEPPLIESQPSSPVNSVTEEEFNPSVFNLSIPDDVTIPRTLKEHSLIEKTAEFISQHGSQIEILIKTKQSNNASLEFMNYGSPLYKYYKFLVETMRRGEYKFASDKAGQDGSDSDSDSSDGGYLHPSLLGGSKSIEQTPRIIMPRVKDENCSYSLIVQNLKGKFASTASTDNSDSPKPSEEKSLTSDKPLMNQSLLPTPPPEIELIIDKLASYVAKSGDKFEQQVKKRGDERFDFLNPGHMYHAHYIRRKLHYIGEMRKQAVAEKAESISADKNKSISFSLSVKEKKISRADEEKWDNGSVSQKRDTKERGLDSDRELANKLAVAAKDGLSREKKLQEERKRRTQLFISLLKANQEGASKEGVVGPTLPSIVAPSTKADSTSNDKSEDKPKTSTRKSAIIPFTRPDKHHHHKHRRHSRSRSRSPSPRRSKSSRKHR